MDGLRFVTEGRFQFAVSGLRIDVQQVWGRESIVAYRSGLGGSC